MAKVQLTERQQDIKTRLDKGDTPEKVGKALKISTNAVYQQIRRMRKAGVKVGGTAQGGGSTGNTRTQRRASGSTARKASTTRRQSARTRPAATPKPPATAEELLKAEIAEIEASVEAETARIAEAEGVITEAKAAIETASVERERRADVLAVLTGEKVAHAKPAPKPAPAAKPAGKKGGKGNGAQAAQTAPAASEAPEAVPAADGAQAAPEAAPAADAAATPQPATQAEREATADPFEVGDGAEAEAEAAQAAAEAPAAA